jgi:hypothetical protein
MFAFVPEPIAMTQRRALHALMEFIMNNYLNGLTLQTKHANNAQLIQGSVKTN